MDFPYAGFTLAAPEEFKEVTGEIRTNDFGEVGVDSGIVIGYVAYQAKTEADFMEFLETAGINPRVLRAARRSDTGMESFLVIFRAVSDKADSSAVMACAGSGGQQLTDVPLSSADRCVAVIR